MEELEARLQAVLNDPQQMQELAALARSLGLGAEETDAPPPDAPEQTAPERREAGAMPALPLAELLQQAGGLSKKQENLLRALKPFLRPGKREKLERAVQAARLSSLASHALRSRGEK